MKVIKLEETEGMTFPAGRTTKVLTGPNTLPAKHFTAGYVVIKPGGKIPLHTHTNEEIYVMIQGSGRMRIEGEEERVQAVSAIYIDPNAEHMLQNTESEPLIMIFIYAPAGIMDHWSEEMEGKLT